MKQLRKNVMNLAILGQRFRFCCFSVLFCVVMKYPKTCLDLLSVVTCSIAIGFTQYFCDRAAYFFCTQTGCCLYCYVSLMNWKMKMKINDPLYNFM